MVERIKTGALDEGLVKAVNEISEVMAAQCPAGPEEGPDRFPNRLIAL